MTTYIEKQTELPEYPKHWVTVNGAPVKRLEHIPRQLVIRKADLFYHVRHDRLF